MYGELIKARIDDYLIKLGRGEVEIPPALVSEFVKKVEQKVLETKKKDEFTIRLSAIGRPLCQLQLERDGVAREATHEPNTIFRFQAGDMLEHWLIMIICASGLNVKGEAIPCKLDLGGHMISGTADIDIDDIIWDIKTASPYSFGKFQRGFSELLEDDPFGYVAQGFCYGKALRKRFGGWIIINKASGDIHITEVPEPYEEHEDRAVYFATRQTLALTEGVPFARQFKDEEELFRKKPTGNRILGTTCGFCDFKNHCWGTVIHAPEAFSEAKNPKWKYYTELNYTNASASNPE